jgi:uncharacterized protein HemY
VIGAVMVLTLIDFLISIVTNLFKLSIAWQIVYVIFTSIHLMLEAGSVLQAWKIYRLITTGHLRTSSLILFCYRYYFVESFNYKSKFTVGFNQR